MSLKKSGYVWALAAAGVAGCRVGPDYQPTPPATMPATWAPTTAPVQPSNPTTQPANLAGWWHDLNDEVLDQLIDRAIAGNLTVKQAFARVQQARAQKGVSQSGYYPSVNATGAAGLNQAPGSDAVTNQYRTGFDAAWELDVFGGVSRSVESADAGIVAANAELRDSLVTLLGDVAANYIELRGLQQRIIISRDNLELQEKTQKLVERQFAGGLASRLDLVNAQAQTATTRSQIPLLEAAARSRIYVLSVLMGQEPASLISLLEPSGATPGVPAQIPVGLPSDLLRRRPDIRAAEARLHAATANIGVAVAELYPKFSLTGSVGLSSGRLSQFGEGDFFNLGPTASWNLFSGGRLQSNIKVQEAIRNQSFYAYQQTILLAFREVDTALVNFAREQERRQALADSVTASRAAVDLSKKLWTEGQVDFLNVLSAQRSLLQAEDSYQQSTATVAINLVALYKALGGGWEHYSVSTTQPMKEPPAIDQKVFRATTMPAERN